MAKYPGYPLWPARAVNAADRALAGRRRSPSDVAIQFLGRDRFAYVPNSVIQVYKTHGNSSRQKGVLRALGPALEFH